MTETTINVSGVENMHDISTNVHAEGTVIPGTSTNIATAETVFSKTSTKVSGVETIPETLKKVANEESMREIAINVSSVESTPETAITVTAVKKMFETLANTFSLGTMNVSGFETRPKTSTDVNVSRTEIIPESPMNVSEVETMLDISVNVSGTEIIPETPMNLSEVETMSETSINVSGLTIMPETSMNISGIEPMPETSMNISGIEPMSETSINVENLSDTSINVFTIEDLPETSANVLAAKNNLSETSLNVAGAETRSETRENYTGPETIPDTITNTVIAEYNMSDTSINAAGVESMPEIAINVPAAEIISPEIEMENIPEVITYVFCEEEIVKMLDDAETMSDISRNTSAIETVKPDTSVNVVDADNMSRTLTYGSDETIVASTETLYYSSTNVASTGIMPDTSIQVAAAVPDDANNEESVNEDSRTVTGQKRSYPYIEEWVECAKRSRPSTTSSNNFLLSQDEMSPSSSPDIDDISPTSSPSPTVVNSLAEVLQNYLQKQIEGMKKDEYSNFGEYVACSLRQITNDKIRMTLKYAIMRLILARQAEDTESD